MGLYWPALGFDFLIYDDNVYITDNPRIAGGLTWDNLRWAFTTLHYGTWQPVTWISYFIDAQLFGVSPRGFHATNIMIHGFNSALVFLLFRRMTAQVLPSLLLAALFAFHPLRVESVAWVADRKVLVCTFFGLLSLLAYHRYTLTKSTAAYASALVGFALGLMAKPMLITLPFVFLLLDYWPLARFGPPLKKLFVEKLPFFFLCAGSAWLTTLAHLKGQGLASTDHFPLSMRLANATVSYVQYIGKAIYPSELAILYKHPGMPPHSQWITCAVLLLAVTAAVLLATRSRPYLLVGWCWFLGTLLPMSGIVGFGSHAMADRFTYIPLIGLFGIAAWGLFDLTRPYAHAQKIYLLVSLVLITLCVTRTQSQLKHWKNSETIFKHTLSVTQGNEIAHVNLGLAYATEERHSEALVQYRAALAITPADKRIHDLLSQTHIRLANDFAQQEQYPEAETHYREAIRFDPARVDAHVNLGNTLVMAHRPEEAISEYELALTESPDHWSAHFNLADLYTKAGQAEQAIGHFREVLRIKPRYVAAQIGLAAAYHEAGREQEAVEQLLQTQKDHPQNEYVRKIVESVLSDKDTPTP